MIVVSNTSPLRYLITVGQATLIHNLFGHVVIPRAVELELTHPSAPAAVREWMAHPPNWIEVRDLSAPPGTPLIRHLDSGEAEAIQLAIDLIAGALIMDERIGRGMAKARNIPVIGILGILLESYRRGAISEPAKVLAELRAAGFRISQRLRLEFESQVASTKPPLP
jgi:predicted nucleic acid-binding protein